MITDSVARSDSAITSVAVIIGVTFGHQCDGLVTGVTRVFYLFRSFTNQWLINDYGCASVANAHTHNTHIIVLLLFSGTTRVSRYQKGKTRKGKSNLDLLEQEIVSGSGHLLGYMQICTSSQTTTPTSHHSVFYRPDALPAAQPTASKH